MEPDFVTRNELDSLFPENDPSTSELLNTYKFPPKEVTPSQPQAQSQSQMSGFGVYNPHSAFIGHMLGQLQTDVKNLSKPAKNTLDGIQFSANADILRWICLFAFLLLFVYVVMKLQRQRRNPLRRLKRLERELKRLKNPIALDLDDSDEDLDDEDEDDDLDDGDDDFDDDFDDD